MGLLEREKYLNTLSEKMTCSIKRKRSEQVAIVDFVVKTVSASSRFPLLLGDQGGNVSDWGF